MSETPVYLDNETNQPVAQDVAETLWELEQEGQVPEGVHKKEAAEKKEDKKDDEDPNKKDDKEDKGDSKDKEDKDGENEDDKNEDDKGEDKKDREPKYVPIWTMKKALKDLENKHEEEKAEILSKAGKAADKSVDDKGIIDTAALEKEAEKIAQETGVKPEAMKAIVKVLAQQLETQLKDKLGKVDEITQRNRAELEENLYKSDFEKSIKSFSPEQQEHLKGKAKQIKEQAYTKEYGGTPLRTILIEFLHDNPVPEKKKSAENTRTTGGGSGESKGDVDFENVTEADIAGMDDETADRYFDWLDKTKKNKGGWQGR